MDKQEHGKRLASAMAAKRHGRQVIADLTGRDVRTVTNWTRGKTMPSEVELILLREFLGPYDLPGDPVEIAVRGSELDEYRQYEVIGFYKKHLQQQRAQEAG